VRDRVAEFLAEREGMDRGLSGGVLLSVLGHVVVVGGGLLASLLLPRPPLISPALAWVVPAGGGGSPAQAPPAPAPSEAPVASEPAAPEAPAVTLPPVIKPPKEEPPKNAIPEFEKKRSKKKPSPRPAASERNPDEKRSSKGGTRGGTGSSSQTPGIQIGPDVGPGVPGGSDSGDWYLASVQQRIWGIWMQQIRGAASPSVTVSFTILADGSLADEPRVVQSSGLFAIDSAAKRAIDSAAPFGRLPRTYGTDRFTIEAVFTPTR